MTVSLPRHTFIGVDVAKQQLVINHHGHAKTTSIDNTRKAIKHWLTCLPKHSIIGMESTGGYHELLSSLAYEHGLAVYVLNPRDVHHYANAISARAKTDQVDAVVIARFVAHEHQSLHPWQPKTAQQKQLDELIARRSVIVRSRDAMRQTLKHLQGLQDEGKQAILGLKQLLAAIDRQIDAVLASREQLKQKAARIQSIPGIGRLTGAMLLSRFERMRDANQNAIIAMTGLDPRPCDSGAKRGRRKLSKRGSAEGRRLLYNAAMAASQSAAWKPYYERELGKGLSKTAAFVCLARRLVKVAWAVYQSDKPFDPKKLKAA